MFPAGSLRIFLSPSLSPKLTPTLFSHPDHRKGKKVASLDSIAADVKRHKRKEKEELWRDEALLPAEMAQQLSHQTPLTHLASQQHTTATSPDGGSCDYWENGPETGSPMEVENTDSKLPKLSFDEDSDLELQTRYVCVCVCVCVCVRVCVRACV